MKKIHIVALSAIIVLVTSCFKDESNYNLIGAEKIEVTGINKIYEKVFMVDTLKITPTVTSTVSGSSFEYFWGIYETSVGSGVTQPFDTLCKTKDLTYFVKKPASGWTLVFCAKNTKTGYFSFTYVTLNISTQFTRGWYVLKDEGSKSDLDLFLTPTSIVPTSKKENVYSLINGKKLDGTAINLCFDSRFRTQYGANWYDYMNYRELFLIASKDISLVNMSTLIEWGDFKKLYFTAPVNKSPNVVFLSSNGKYIINDGQVYSQNSVYGNEGKFGSKLLKDADDKVYNMSPFFLTATNSNPIFFDETSSSFCTTAITTTMFSYFTDATGTAMKATNNNKTLLYMGLKATATLTGIAVFKDKTNSALKILSTITTPATGTMKIVNDTLLPTSNLFNATKYTCNLNDENILYFVTGGNQLWSRNLTNKFEQLQFTAPAGETITYIGHKAYTLETAYAYNYVIIATRNGSNYTIRMFTKTAGNLAATPAFTLTGTGSVADVIYISPSVVYNTYPSTF
jgi:hypothetical protein